MIITMRWPTKQITILDQYSLSVYSYAANLSITVDGEAQTLSASNKIIFNSLNNPFALLVQYHGITIYSNSYSAN